MYMRNEIPNQCVQIVYNYIFYLTWIFNDLIILFHSSKWSLNVSCFIFPWRGPRAQWATRRTWPQVLFSKVQILEWIHLWLVYLTLKLNFQKSSQTLKKSMVKKFVHKSLIIRRRFLLLTYQNILKWKTISNEWLTHKLHCVKKLFRLNHRRNGK